jgi:hypothetical protein
MNFDLINTQLGAVKSMQSSVQQEKTPTVSATSFAAICFHVFNTIGDRNDNNNDNNDMTTTTMGARN